MEIRDQEGRVQDYIPVKNVILSVAKKDGLSELAQDLIKTCQGVKLFSTGGTYKQLKKDLGLGDDRLVEISHYTDFPEMDGGLVKTLHPKIHAGILGERGNPKHEKYLEDTLSGAVYIDIVVVNLYEFEKQISKKGVTFEDARGYMDIGGHTMIRGAAKNLLGCAVTCDPRDYQNILKHIADNEGCTSFEARLALADKALNQIANYDLSIARYVTEQHKSNVTEIKKLYGLEPKVNNDLVLAP